MTNAPSSEPTILETTVAVVLAAGADGRITEVLEHDEIPSTVEGATHEINVGTYVSNGVKLLNQIDALAATPLPVLDKGSEVQVVITLG